MWHEMFCQGWQNDMRCIFSKVAEMECDVLSRAAKVYCQRLQKWHGMFCQW